MHNFLSIIEAKIKLFFENCKYHRFFQRFSEKKPDDI